MEPRDAAIVVIDPTGKNKPLRFSSNTIKIGTGGLAGIDVPVGAVDPQWTLTASIEAENIKFDIPINSPWMVDGVSRTGSVTTSLVSFVSLPVQGAGFVSLVIVNQKSITTVKEMDALVGGYEIEAFLGRGGQGVVLGLKSPTSHDPVALKLWFSNRGCLQRELDILKKLSHKNIIVPINAVQSSKFGAVTLPWCECDLRGYLKKFPCLPKIQKLRLAEALMEGLCYLHAHMVMHRDLKPGNLLMPSQDPADLKIADFGLAKVLEGDLTTSTMVGTPYWRAPETTGTSSSDKLAKITSEPSESSYQSSYHSIYQARASGSQLYPSRLGSQAASGFVQPESQSRRSQLPSSQIVHPSIGSQNIPSSPSGFESWNSAQAVNQSSGHKLITSHPADPRTQKVVTESYGLSADIWSAGCVLFELLNGPGTLFRASTAAASNSLYRQGQLQWSEQVIFDYLELFEIIQSMVQVSPSERPSAEQVLSRIRDIPR